MGAWTDHPLPAAFAEWWRDNMAPNPPPAWKTHSSGLTAIVGRELWRGETEVRWHISLRYGDPGRNGRVPTWDELVEACHALRPGVPFVVGIPPRSYWMSVHPDVLHAWEARDPAMVAQWRENRGTGQRQ